MGYDDISSGYSLNHLLRKELIEIAFNEYTISVVDRFRRHPTSIYVVAVMSTVLPETIACDKGRGSSLIDSTPWGRGPLRLLKLQKEGKKKPIKSHDIIQTTFIRGRHKKIKNIISQFILIKALMLFHFVLKNKVIQDKIFAFFFLLSHHYYTLNCSIPYCAASAVCQQ